jgi:hypothetical protein
MSWRTTAVLFLLLLLLAGYVYWESQRETAPATEPAPVAAVESERLVTGATDEDVRRLDISRREDGLAVSFSRDAGGHWVQTVPTTTQVISYTMEYAAGNLVTMTSRRSLPAGANPLAAYGLDNPAYQVTLAVEEADGRLIRYTFNLGDAVATGDGRYVQKQGDGRIHIVASFVFGSIIDLLDNPPLPEVEVEAAAEESPPPPVFEQQLDTTPESAP